MFKKEKLKNGIRLVAIPAPATKAATILILYRVGSRYEPQKLAGVSHYIEHMMFKGTKKRPNTLDISRELDQVGAEYNAFTGKDLTGYWIKVAGDDFSLALDIVSDMLQNSKFDKTEFGRELKVILEEIHMYRDNPMMHIEDLFEDALFADSTLGRNIAGTDETMKGIPHEGMLGYVKEYYRPSRIVVAVAGALPKDYKSQVEKMLGGIKEQNIKATEFKKWQPHDHKKRFVVEYKETEQVQVALGFEGISYFDPAREALKILAVILGGTMSSRLFIQVRERRGLAYMVRANTECFEDTGIFAVRAGLNSARVAEALTVIRKELEKVAKEGITAKELKFAKENLRGKLALSLEESSELASYFGNQELFTGEISTPEEKLKRIEKVTLADVRAVAKRVIKFDKLHAAMIGPFKDESVFKPLK